MQQADGNEPFTRQATVVRQMAIEQIIQENAEPNREELPAVTMLAEETPESYTVPDIIRADGNRNDEQPLPLQPAKKDLPPLPLPSPESEHIPPSETDPAPLSGNPAMEPHMSAETAPATPEMPTETADDTSVEPPENPKLHDAPSTPETMEIPAFTPEFTETSNNQEQLPGTETTPPHIMETLIIFSEESPTETLEAQHTLRQSIALGFAALEPEQRTEAIITYEALTAVAAEITESIAALSSDMPTSETPDLPPELEELLETLQTQCAIFLEALHLPADETGAARLVQLLLPDEVTAKLSQLHFSFEPGTYPADRGTHEHKLTDSTGDKSAWSTTIKEELLAALGRYVLRARPSSANAAS